MRIGLVCIIAIAALSSCDMSWWLGSQYSRTFTWEYGDARYEMSFDVAEGTYEFYDSLPPHNAYETYVWESQEHKYLAALAGKLYEKGSFDRLSDREIAEFVLAFVQSVGYVSHPERIREYTKYPILTLIKGGNCSDMSVLYASICETLGIETILITVPWHMFVGVSCRGCSGYAFMFRQSKYYTAECTAEGWRIGEIDFSVDTSRTVTLIDVERPAEFISKGRGTRNRKEHSIHN